MDLTYWDPNTGKNVDVTAATPMPVAAVGGGTKQASNVLNVEGEETVLALEGRRTVVVHCQDPSGSFTGTLVPYISFDGTTWGSAWLVNSFYQDAASSLAYVSPSDFYTLLVPPWAHSVKIACEGYGGGSATVTLIATYEAGISWTFGLENGMMTGTNNATRTVAGQGSCQNPANEASSPFVAGAERRATNPSAYTDGDVGRLISDLLGRLVTLPYSVPELTLSGKTADITGTGNTAVIAAQGAGKRIYVTHLAVRNSHASVGTWVNLKDGSTTIWTDYAGPNGGGFAYPLPAPLRGTANTALNVACETTGANVRCSAGGYQGV
jgi:hypothetical protein